MTIDNVVELPIPNAITALLPSCGRHEDLVALARRVWNWHVRSTLGGRYTQMCFLWLHKECLSSRMTAGVCFNWPGLALRAWWESIDGKKNHKWEKQHLRVTPPTEECRRRTQRQHSHAASVVTVLDVLQALVNPGLDIDTVQTLRIIQVQESYHGSEDLHFF